MKIHRIDQRTEEWFNLRAGIPCTSGFKNIITPLGKPTTGDRRETYRNRLVAERLLGYSMDDRFENYWTLRGKEMEHPAAEAFMRFRGVELLNGCFITDDDETIGCSPDRIIGTSYEDARECLEMKAPAPWTHLGYLLDGPGKDHKQQVQGQLLIGEFEINHFWSYHPQMPPCHVMTERDEEFIAKLVVELAVFCDELDHEEARARAMGEFIPGREPPMDVPGVFPWVQTGAGRMQ